MIFIYCIGIKVTEPFFVSDYNIRHNFKILKINVNGIEK